MTIAHDLTLATFLACTLDRRALAVALAWLKHVVPRRTSVPVLEHVLVRASDTTVTLTATDLDVLVETTLPADVALAGTLLVPVRRLADAVKLGRGPATVSLLDNHLTVGAAVYALPTLDPAAYPALPTPSATPDAVIPRATLARMVRRTAYAMSTDATRPHLCGALLERTDGRLRLVATDGHRLAVAGTPDAGADLAAIVHRRGLEELARWLATPGGDVAVACTPDRVWFTSGSDAITAVRVDAAFPRWAQVVPQTSTGRVTFARRELLAALAAVAPARTTTGVRLTLAQSRTAVELAASDGMGNDARTTLAAYAEGDVPATFGVNARYLRELLESLDDDYGVTLEVNGALDPITVAGTHGATAVVMPMRV